MLHLVWATSVANLVRVCSSSCNLNGFGFKTALGVLERAIHTYIHIYIWGHIS